MRLLVKTLRTSALIITLVLIVFASFQRSLLYHPSHDNSSSELTPWHFQGEPIGLYRKIDSPENIWLFAHGNSGQAADRSYALSSFSQKDAVYILEYPGFGQRKGSPSKESFNRAVTQAYELLRKQYPQTPICAVGESIGTGPVSHLGSHVMPPDKIVLIVPFDRLDRVASHHYPFLPIKFLLSDNWDNVKSLASYTGPVDIFGAKNDEVIPFICAEDLAKSRSNFRFHAIEGTHNEWSNGVKVRIRNP